MGSDYYYLYSDQAKTDMNKIKSNQRNNEDFAKLNNMMNQRERQNINIELDKTFKFLKVRKVYLGFNSAFEIYKRYENHFRANGLSERDASHPSLFFDFGDGCSYYVDYLPDKGKSKSAVFLYKNQYGLRYAEKPFEDFIRHNDTVVITLKVNDDITFYNYFINVCRNEEWTREKHNYERHNCNHFVLKSLTLLNVRLDNEENFEENFLFTKEFQSSKRDLIKQKIPFLFHQILGINY